MKNLVQTTQTHLIKFNHLPVEVKIFWTYDNTEPDFDFGNEEENKKEMRRFETGELMNVIVFVEVSALGLVERDSLSQCFVSAKTLEKDVLGIVSEHDMKNIACGYLQNRLVDLAEQFKQYGIQG